MNRWRWLAIVLLLTPALAQAAPAVSSVSGTWSHGQTVVITGTNFGAKSPAKPIVWADFEGCTDGTQTGTAPTNLGNVTAWNQIGGNCTTANPTANSTRSIRGQSTIAPGSSQQIANVNWNLPDGDPNYALGVDVVLAVVKKWYDGENFWTRQNNIIGTATSGSSTTLVDSSQAFSTNQFQSRVITLTAGTCSPDSKTVSSNTATTFTVAGWTDSCVPDTTTQYSVKGAVNYKTFRLRTADVSGLTGPLTPEFIQAYEDAVTPALMRYTAANPYRVNCTQAVSPQTTRSDHGWNPPSVPPVSQWVSEETLVTRAEAGMSYRYLHNGTTQDSIEPITGTATSGAASSLTDTGANFPTGNSSDGLFLEITSGTGSGQVRMVSNTGTATRLDVYNAWTVNPAAGSGYKLKQPSTVDACFSGISGTSSGSNTATTLNDTTQNWASAAYAGYAIEITGGLGSGQTRSISTNTATAITVTSAWTTTPDATSTYNITHTLTNHWHSIALDNFVTLNPPPLNSYVYMDDIYVDNTRAWTCLATESTWASRTLCEPQIPSAWADTEITVTVNKGALVCATCYLYVVDSTGAVNANGFAVAAIPPIVPTILRTLYEFFF